MTKVCEIRRSRVPSFLGEELNRKSCEEEEKGRIFRRFLCLSSARNKVRSLTPFRKLQLKSRMGSLKRRFRAPGLGFQVSRATHKLRTEARREKKVGARIHRLEEEFKNSPPHFLSLCSVSDSHVRSFLVSNVSSAFSIVVFGGKSR